MGKNRVSLDAVCAALAYAMGIDGGCGSHGLDMDEDLHIVHLYKAYPAE